MPWRQEERTGGTNTAYIPGHQIRNGSAGSGRISYSRKGVFLTNFSIAAPEFIEFLLMPATLAFLLPPPFLFDALYILCTTGGRTIQKQF